ncbi:MAG: S16 family serine protease [Bacillota bacterium]
MLTVIKQFKRYKWVFITLAIPYLLMMFLLTYRIDYSLSAPGGLAEVEDQVTFETMYDTETTFYTTYVMVVDQPTFFQFIVSYFDEGIDSREINQFTASQSDEQRIQYGHLQRDNAWNAAIISSYQALGIDIDYDIKQIVTRIYTDYADIGTLEVTDEILSVNGSTSNINDIINDAACNETLTITAESNDGEIKVTEARKTEVDGYCRLWITVEPYYDIIASDNPYTINNSFVGGPSGGLMQFLHIYNTLTEADLAEGYKIAGTGGIALDGSVLSMGSIKQKVITAHHQDVDIFFVPRLDDDNPNDNYQIAVRTLETLETDMKVVGVSHWTEAVDYLTSLEGDH